MALTVHFPCAIIIIIRLSQLVVGRDQPGNNFSGLKQADPRCPQATLLSHCLIKSLWQLVFSEGLTPEIWNLFSPVSCSRTRTSHRSKSNTVPVEYSIFRKVKSLTRSRNPWTTFGTMSVMYGLDSDLDPAPAFFVSGWQDANKNEFFLLIIFWKYQVLYILLIDEKSKRSQKIIEIKVFLFLFFCLKDTYESGAVQNNAGSWKHKNMRIRIHNTIILHSAAYGIFLLVLVPGSPSWPCFSLWGCDRPDIPGVAWFSLTVILPAGGGERGLALY